MGKLEDAKTVARANKDILQKTGGEDQLRILIMERVPCSKSTANSAISSIRAKKPEGRKKPEITVLSRTEGGEGKPTILGKEREQKKKELEELVEIKHKGELGAKLLGEGELNAEDMSTMFLAMNELFPKETRPSARSATMLGKLSYKPFNKWWATISEENPLIAIAGVAIGVVYAPAIIRSVIQWQKSRKPEKKEEKKKEKS